MCWRESWQTAPGFVDFAVYGGHNPPLTYSLNCRVCTVIKACSLNANVAMGKLSEVDACDIAAKVFRHAGYAGWSSAVVATFV